MSAPRRAAARQWALLAAFALAWVALAAAITRTPPIDNVEQLVWRQSLEWGYYKHPPLPTWLLAAASPAWPATPTLTALLGAGCMALALAQMATLARRLLGAGDARALLLAALCMPYATTRLPIYNHNVVLAPLVGAAALLLWRATERPRLASWAAIGLVLGLGMLAKYQMALVAACVALWWLRIGGWRHVVHRAGLPLAALVAAVVFAPNVAWLAAHDFAPLQYASDSGLGAHLTPLARLTALVAWLADWWGNRLGLAWLLLAAVALAVVRRRRRGVGEPLQTPAAPAPLARDFLLLWGLGPMALMGLIALLAGSHLQPKWSTAFALWTLPAVVALAPPRWRLGAAALPRAAWVAFAALQALLVAAALWNAQRAARDPLAPGAWQQRDFSALAASVAEPAQRALGGPIERVSGPYGMAGMLARELPGHPLPLIDGDLAKSPWAARTEAPAGGARTISVWPACALTPGAAWLAPGWAWWPRPAPPALPDGPAGEHEAHVRGLARTNGGAVAVRCP